MALYPSSTIGKTIAAIWVSLCIAVLIFGYAKQSIHDMPVGFAWLMIFLTAPTGLLALVALFGMSFLSDALGYSYHPFWELVPYWLAAVTLGYIQWFVALPMLWKRFFRGKTI